MPHLSNVSLKKKLYLSTVNLPVAPVLEMLLLKIQPILNTPDFRRE
jgi:hypothetical protein